MTALQSLEPILEILSAPGSFFLFSLNGAYQTQNPKNKNNDRNNPAEVRNPRQNKCSQIKSQRLPDVITCKLVFVVAVYDDCNDPPNNCNMCYNCFCFSIHSSLF